MWRRRDLIRTLAERDFKARYKQATLGAGWAVLNPLLLLVVFTLLFDRVADIDTNGVPYSLFSYLGLLPWTFFSTSLSRGSNSMLWNRALLNKVKVPREVFPISSVAVSGVDFVIATSMLVILFFVEGFAPQGTSYWVPLFFVIQVAFGIAVALVFSAVIVHLRDITHLVPLVLQAGLFATPVAFGLADLPEQMLVPYAALNPLVGVIGGYRDTVLYGSQPDLGITLASACGALFYLAVSYVVFKRLEGTIADVA